MERITGLEDWKEVKKKGWEKLFPKDRIRICVGMATCGIAAGADKVFKKGEEIVSSRKLPIDIVKVGCIGFCKEEPIVTVHVPGKPLLLYNEVTPEILENIIDDAIKDRLSVKPFCKIEEWDNIVNDEKFTYGKGYDEVPFYKDIPFFSKQKKIVLRNCGLTNPEDIEEYIGSGGYYPLIKVLTEMTPEEVIEEVTNSGLRGRGGAGFPTGIKWNFVKQAKGDFKYIICNADEGDPGAYMNRNELESDPHMIVEGMIIGAYAMGAREGIVYIREEYPLAIEKIKKAIEDAYKYGFLGENILGTDFSFDIRIVKGAGAFVCGEETALIASIEGKPGRPRPKPPFPAQKGLYDKPTDINNVETWTNIPVIIKKGADWFKSIGVEKNSGTKVFSLVGKVKNVGLVEVPLGTKLKEIIYDIGEGGVGGKKIKAVQTGGPSGGCIPAEKFDLSVDYETLKAAGSIMGSGGMVVMDENTCIVDIAKYFLTFTQAESCGKCVPCRAGTRIMLETLEKISRGEGEEKDITLLKELGETIKKGALCALGQTAPNPVLTTLKYFENEYIEHIVYKRCPQGVCELSIAPCMSACPAGVDVPAYVAYMAEGKLKEAFYTHIKANPFPIACGKACPAFCEKMCRRAQLDSPVAIRQLKRVFADKSMEEGWELYKPEKYNGKKVAVVGGGPGGLTAAYFLNLKGYKVTVFEKNEEAGGALRYLLPEHRLPTEAVKFEVERIKRTGVEIITGREIKSLDELKDFDAIFLACGAHKEVKLGIKGEDLKNVIPAFKFLKSVKSGEFKDKISGKVIVIGGGNAAIDSARVAWRLGGDVTIVYRRGEQDMPAFKEEIEEAKREGIEIMTLTNPVEFIGDEEGKVKRAKLIKMKYGEYDLSGRRRPIPIPGSEFEIDVSMVVVAIGQKIDVNFEGIDVEHGVVKVDHNLMTSVEGVFAGGDLVRGPSTIVEAIGDGKKAAMAIDKYLGGDGILFKEERKVVETTYDEEKYQEEMERVKPVLVAPEDRRAIHVEVEKTIDVKDAVEEARRCVHCDRREEEE